QRCRATGAAAGDDKALGLDFASFSEIASTLKQTADIHDAPLFVQSSPVLPTEPGTPAIIHIEHGEPAAGPILNRETQRGRSRGCWSTMTLHDERWLFVVGRTKVWILWRIEKTVGDQSTFGWEVDCSRPPVVARNRL